MSADVTKELLEALKEIHNWLVCAPIATAEDMAESFPYMERLAEAAIARAEAAMAEPQPDADGWIPWAGGDEPQPDADGWIPWAGGDEPQPDADGWIPWAGGDEPVGRDTPVDLRYRDSEIWPDKLDVPSGYCHLESSEPYWRNDGGSSDIIAYRVVKR